MNEVQDFAIATGAIISSRPCGHPLTDQSRIHRLCGADGTARSADPFMAFVPGIQAIGDALTLQHPGFGAVITHQAVTVRKAHPVSAPAFVNGRVLELQEQANGITFATLLLATDETGEPFAELTTTMLLIDPARPPQAKPARAPQSATGSPAAEEIIGRHGFSPDQANLYAGDAPTPHNDPEFARAVGFEKPIVSGNEVLSILWARFIEPNHPLPVSMNFTLKRPIFWDEEVSFVRLPPNSTAVQIIEVRTASGKTAIRCELSKPL